MSDEVKPPVIPGFETGEIRKNLMLDKAKIAWLTWRLVIVYIVLFSINTLSVAITAALINATWTQIDTQGRIMIVVSIVSNWTGTMLAFVVGLIHKTKDGNGSQIV